MLTRPAKTRSVRACHPAFLKLSMNETMHNSPAEQFADGAIPVARNRRAWLKVLKWSACAIVLGFVVWRAATLWRKDELQGIDVHFGWLLAAGVVYLVSWLPSVWFWRAMIHALGGRVRFRDAARAYYCGHLGKYIPGKAMVLVIRATLLKDRGTRLIPAALTAAYETLLMMGTGVAVGLAVLPFANASTWLSHWITSPALAGAVVVAACLMALPVLSRLLSWVALRMMPGELCGTEGKTTIPTRLIAAGLSAFVVSWALQGLCLGLTLRSISPAGFELADWPLWTGASAMATSVGFLVLFAPGGAGVREGLLIEILKNHPQIGPGKAVVAAVLVRAVGLVAEIALAGVLYYMGRKPLESVES